MDNLQMEPPGFWDAVLFLERYTRHSRAALEAAMRSSIESVLTTNAIRSATMGFMVEIDGEGDVRVWVDPSIWHRHDTVTPGERRLRPPLGSSVVKR